MYKKGTGNDKQRKGAGIRTLCPYRNFSQAIMSGKVKEYTIEELFRSPFTELAFEFYYKKEFVLIVLIQIHQTYKNKVQMLFKFSLFNAIL